MSEKRNSSGSTRISYLFAFAIYAGVCVFSIYMSFVVEGGILIFLSKLFAVVSGLCALLALYCFVSFEEDPDWQTKPQNMSAEERKKQEIEKYKQVLEKLSRSQVYKVKDLVFTAVVSVNEAVGQERLLQVGQATLDLIEEEKFGTPTYEQKVAIDKILKECEESMTCYVPALQRSIGKASNTGLGFGVITNSGADMALYGAMNAHEKNKNAMLANRDANQILDREIMSLISKIRTIVM